MRLWVIDSGRSRLAIPPGDGPAKIVGGDLVHWVEPRDVLALYSTVDNFLSCVVHDALLVKNSDTNFGILEVERRASTLEVIPSGPVARSYWRRRVELCLDVNKVKSYGFVEWIRHVFPELDLQEKSIRDGKSWAVRFDPTKPRRDDENGYVYLIKGESTYKIGKSKDPRRRTSEVRRDVVEEVELLHYFPSNWYSRAEWELHQRFKSKSAYREWFDLADEDVAHIRSIHEMNYE